jgi:hypothetical protein
MLDEGLRDESKSQVESKDADGADDGKRGWIPLRSRQEIAKIRPPESSTQERAEAEEASLSNEEIARTKASTCRERNGYGDLERAPGNERREQALSSSRSWAASGERKTGRHGAQKDDREGRKVGEMACERNHDATADLATRVRR